MPRASRGYRRYLPLFPRAIESFDLNGYDLVVSTSHCVAKGVRTDALHVCYCHTPMRYVWDQFDAYFGAGRADVLTRLAAHAVRGPLQRWDRASAARVHHFVANSETVRSRIRRYYERDAEIVHPPVDCDTFEVDAGPPEDYFLVVSALSGYKRVDLAVEAARRAGVQLRVVGQGPDASRLQRRAQGGAIEFLPWQSQVDLVRLYARCRALVFPGEEDFGIAPVEAMAAGRPVIALAAGGAAETVVHGRTGILVPSLQLEPWIEALQGFEPNAFDSGALRAHARRFDRPRYAAAMQAIVEREWKRWRETCRG